MSVGTSSIPITRENFQLERGKQMDHRVYIFEDHSAFCNIEIASNILYIHVLCLHCGVRLHETAYFTIRQEAG